MKEKYPIVFLCQLMNVSKSGYYKWKNRQGKLNRYEQDRLLLTKLLTEQHQKHPSHGYHMLADDVFQSTGWVFSQNLAHKCCKEAGIHSKARKYRYKKKDAEENVEFPNKVNGNWNATGPIQIVVSDMTIFKNKGKNWEWTLLVDTFNNEILAHQATPVSGSSKPYYHCLEVLKKLAGKKNEEQTPQVVLHTDQGSVYSSQAFRQAHEHYNILRSMSKVGTPTDNAIIEALNGWIKEELYLDFGLETAEDVPKLLDEYVYYFNNRRPAAALGYKSPVQYKTELGF